MDALTRIPKVLETVDEMRRNHPLEEVFSNYKHNVKLFIQNMKDQVVASSPNMKRPSQTYNKKYRHSKRSSSPSLSSPRKSKEIDLMQTAYSNILTPFKITTKLEELPISTILKKKSIEEEPHFPEELVSPQSSMWEQSQSKFETNSKKRRQREEELRFFLQAGKKNMNVTTDQFLQAIGRTPQQESKQEEDPCEEMVQKNNSKREQSLNQSLGQICESLQTSFVSKRARSEKKKQQDKRLQEQKRKLKVEQETAKMLKDRGIKNLLQRLRDNVENSAQGPRQKITTSKLISCRDPKPTGEANSPGRNKSKVMINPVPVDIAKRNQVGERNRSPSPERKPQSILKRSSTILSREISTFSFNDITI